MVPNTNEKITTYQEKNKTDDVPNQLPKPSMHHSLIDESMLSFPVKRYKNYMELLTSDECLKFKLSPDITKKQLKQLKQINSTKDFFHNGCFIKSSITGAGGGFLGFFIGTFMFAIKPVDLDTTLKFKDQIRKAYAGYGKDVIGNMKSFAKVGFLYSFIDCIIARHRAKQDLITAMYAGCGTGAFLGRKSGVSGMLAGCSGFAAFSAVMEIWDPLSHK